MKEKNSIILYKFLLKEKDLSIKQKIVLSQILYMIYKNKEEEIVLSNDLKQKIKDTLQYHKDTINLTIKKADNLGILSDINKNTFYIYNEKYKIDRKTTYINIPFDIFFNKDLSETDKIILAYCNSYVKKNKHCIVNNKQISTDLNLSLQIVERSISKLNKEGFIKSKYDKNGFIIKKRDMSIDADNIHNLFVKSIEKFEAKTIENQKIKSVNELNIEKVENQVIEINKVTKLDSMNNIKHIANIDNIKKIDNTFILSNNIELLEKIRNLTISSEDAKRLYFEKKKELELIKEIYDKSIES